PLPAPATYSLSLHDALPIFRRRRSAVRQRPRVAAVVQVARDVDPRHVALHGGRAHRNLEGDLSARLQRDAAVTGLAGLGVERDEDRKSTRLNSSHVAISYAV